LHVWRDWKDMTALEHADVDYERSEKGGCVDAWMLVRVMHVICCPCPYIQMNTQESPCAGYQAFLWNSP